MNTSATARQMDDDPTLQSDIASNEPFSLDATAVEGEAFAVEEEAAGFVVLTPTGAEEERDRRALDTEGLAVEEEALSPVTEEAEGEVPEQDFRAAHEEDARACEKEATALELDTLDYELERMHANRALTEAVETFVEAEDEEAKKTAGDAGGDDTSPAGLEPNAEDAEDDGPGPDARPKKGSGAKRSRKKP